MEIHTFRAASLQEALMLVRHELGPEASVLQTRQVNGKFFGLFGKSSIEVQASRDAKVIRRLPDALTANSFETSGNSDAGFDFTENDALQQSSKSLQFDHADTEDAHNLEEATVINAAHAGDVATSRTAATPRGRSEASSLTARQNDARGRIATGGDTATDGRTVNVNPPAPSGINYLSPAMFEVFTEMLDSDVDPDAARIMLQEVAAHCAPSHLNDAWMIKGRLCQIIQQRVNVSGPIEVRAGARQVVALVGPTGVGKTTTLAKLAAGFHFDQGSSVGFVTLDTFRLGAVEQLQKYADLLGVPCEVVSAPDQMLPALERLNHCQLILIDTAGRSPSDHAQLGALDDFLQVASPTQVHLVLSAASSQAHAAMALEEFASLRPTHLLLTKLDESPCLGSWYSLLASGPWPLSYITTGQQVPEDIVVANRRRIASLILGQNNQLIQK